MNFDFFMTIGKLIVALGFTFGLMFLSFRLMGTKINTVNNNKYIKVIERVQVTKENAILIVKIGNKGYIMTSTAGHMEKLSELSEEEIKNIEEDKKRAAEEMTKYYWDLALKSKENIFKIAKNIRSKEEKNEKK